MSIYFLYDSQNFFLPDMERTSFINYYPGDNRYTRNRIKKKKSKRLRSPLSIKELRFWTFPIQN